MEDNVLVGLVDEILAEVDDPKLREKIVELITQITCYKIQAHDLLNKLFVIKVDSAMKPAEMKNIYEQISRVMNTVLDGTGSRTLMMPDNIRIEDTDIDALVSNLTDGRGHIVYDEAN